MDDQVVFFYLAQTEVLASLVIHRIGFCMEHLSRAYSRLRGIWGWLWFSCGVAHCGGGLIAIFIRLFATVGGAFILAGGLGAGLSFYGVKTLS